MIDTRPDIVEVSAHDIELDRVQVPRRHRGTEVGRIAKNRAAGTAHPIREEQQPREPLPIPSPIDNPERSARQHAGCRRARQLKFRVSGTASRPTYRLNGAGRLLGSSGRNATSCRRSAASSTEP